MSSFFRVTTYDFESNASLVRQSNYFLIAYLFDTNRGSGSLRRSVGSTGTKKCRNSEGPRKSIYIPRLGGSCLQVKSKPVIFSNCRHMMNMRDAGYTCQQSMAFGTVPSTEKYPHGPLTLGRE